MNATYLRYELLRLFRNRRFFIFSLVMPLGLYLTIAGPNRDERIDIGTGEVRFRLFYMVAMAGYGAMIAALGAGARVAIERSVGWNRQLRLTPLTPAMYFAAKVLTGYVMAMASIVLIYAAGISFGVRIHGEHWVQTTALILIATIPFATLGLLAGHVLSAESVGPAIGGAGAFFGILGGIWFPISQDGFLHDVGQCLPSFWIGQASRTAYGGEAWPPQAWLVIAVWTAVTTVLTVKIYQRDTARV